LKLQERQEELAALISQELGSPIKFSMMVQTGLPIMDFASMEQLVAELPWEQRIGNSLVVREPIGVVGAITPWNYPLHQVSPNVILDDADLEAAVVNGIQKCYLNSGQTCSALTRMLVPRAQLPIVEQIAAAALAQTPVGDPFDEATALGPVVSEVQRERVRG